MVNKAIDRLRQLRRERERTVELTDWNLPSQTADTVDNLDLANAQAQLPLEYQVVIRLHYTEGYSTPEIARLLSKPEGTVRRHLSEAYARLRRLLQEDK